MKAAVHIRYGAPDVIHIAEVPKPLPKEDEILVRVHASSVNRTDCGFRDPRPWFVRFFSGLLRPKRQILGTEFSGVVESVGTNVRSFVGGERVFGMSEKHFGTHAEYVCIPQGDMIVTMPVDLSFEDAGAICDGYVMALSSLRAAGVKKGTEILIYGATGSIGTATVQLARYIGAQVTAVCDGKHRGLVRSLGADDVVDATAVDFRQMERTFDVVFDAVGKRTYRECKQLLKPQGIFASTDLGSWYHIPLYALLTAKSAGKRVILTMPKYQIDDFILLRHLLETGMYRPVVDRVYPIEEIVAATSYVESHQKIGNVVITIRS